MVSFDKWVVYDHPKIAWEPNAPQLECAECDRLYQVIAAGRRLGKSYLGSKKILPEAIYTKSLASSLIADGKRREFWIVGPNYSDSEKEFRILWNDLKNLQVPFDKGSFNSPESGHMIIKLWDGAFVCQAKSAQYPDRLVGEGLSGVVLAEAAKLKMSIWPKYILPTLADFNGWALFSSTPEGKNWFYDLYMESKDPYNKDWQSWRFPAWYNRYVYKEETVDSDVYKLVELKKKTRTSIYKLVQELGLVIDKSVLADLNASTPEYFMQEIGADFSEFTGRVFKEFDEEVHVGDLTYNPKWATYGAVDFGYTNPNVWLLIQVGPWGEINVLEEVYQSGLDPQDFAAEIRDRGLCPATLRYFYPDPASPGDARILEKVLGIRARTGTGGELNSRLLHIRKALRENRKAAGDWDYESGTERPRLMFDRKCHGTIKDMLDYRYPEKEEEKETSTKRYELPMKKFDHGPEALGRFFAGTMGQFGRRSEGTREHSSSFVSGNSRRRQKARPVSKTLRSGISRSK